MLALFAVGWVSQGIYTDVHPVSSDEQIAGAFLPSFGMPEDLPGPHDRIAEDQIHVYSGRIIIDLENAEWATFTDTNSMDPVIDAGANAIEIVPKSPDDIHVGDIVSYESAFASGTIIHRVTETGHDGLGWYCKMKGDNLDSPDPGKIRFSQVRRVVVAIIY